jgi:catechol 2,3-dioxygenase-like lactoylglutathione lyase family enzyme
MKAMVNYITLGVDDLERALRFYRDGLGFPTRGILGADDEEGGVVFFELAGGMVLALWPRWSIARDTGLSQGAANPTEFTLSHNVTTSGQVDVLMEEAERAGARILRAAHKTSWGGYTGYFQDPDGHVWEVAWNPEYTPPA